MISLTQAHPRVDLAEEMSTLRFPADQPMDPDRLWSGEGGAAYPRGPLWRLPAGDWIVGRITVAGTRERDVYVVEVPVSSLDEAQVWWRTGEGAWRSAVAGDRVPLTRWPFAAQFPAFPVPIGEEPVDVLLAVSNGAFLRVPVGILPDPAFRENNVRRANLSGLVMGLGGMVAIVCLIGAIQARRRGHWVLAATAAWTLFAIACNNGYMAVWFTPDSPAFNDLGKHFSGMVLAGLMAPLVLESLDGRYLRRAEQLWALAVALLALSYGVAQALWLPAAYRIGGSAAMAALAVATCIGLCALNALRGGRYVVWVAGGVACLLVASGLTFIAQSFVAGLDLRAALLAAGLYTALLLFRQALFLRERYGRDVLSRAAISASRDPLTALWSYDGFQQRVAEAGLREAAGQGAPSMMLLLLPGLEKSGQEHGFVLTERALVRLAAGLQSLLGQEWAIGRLSKTRFAAMSLDPIDAADLVQTATQVLSHCTRISQPLNPVADFDLRIVCRHRGLDAMNFVELLRMLEDAGRALEPGKRITLL